VDELAVGFFCAAQAADIPQLWAVREPEAESGPGKKKSLTPLLPHTDVRQDVSGPHR
jgi:hypothetical protein